MAKRPVWAATDKGRVRKTNEDCFGLSEIISNGSEREEWQGELMIASGCWAVIADGMGGHEAGEVASRAVVETVHLHSSCLQSEAGIVSILHKANAAIFEKIANGTGQPGMGSTIVGVVFFQDKCFTFNIGDSRLYRVRSSRLVQMTVDDTVDALGNDVPRRSHALTQSLGGTRDPVPLFPHLRTWRPMQEDTIILASDGLTDMLRDDEILANIGMKPHPARALVDAALRAGGLDNVTAIVIGPELVQSITT